MNSLLIRYKIKIPVHHVIGNPGLTFTHWFPKGKDITILRKNKLVKIWFNEDCLANAIEALEYKNVVNVVLEYLMVDITVSDVNSELMKYFRVNCNAIPHEEMQLMTQELAIDIYITCCQCVNRLITYAKINLGQHWLELLPTENNRIQEFNILYNAKVTMDLTGEDGWISWNPVVPGVITIISPNEDTYIKESGWGRLVSFVTNDEKPSFVLELLSRSKNLNSFGYHANAIVDAITALELAINKFSKSPDIHLFEQIKCHSRISYSNFSTYCQRLGFTGTVQYLLPLLFTDHQLPETTYKNVLDAINMRQNVIHNGAKKLDREKNRLWIIHVEKLVTLLIAATILDEKRE